MSLKIGDLYSMSVEDVIAAHDAQAVHTSVGTDYWMEELGRRSRVRAIEATDRLARRSYYLSIISTVIALIALAATVVTIVAG